MRESLHIVKVGGAILEDAALKEELLREFASIDGLKILVHGGGRSASALAQRLGVAVHMVDGRRITDAPMMEICTMVYGGLVGRGVVTDLQALGVNAVSLSGADLDSVHSVKRPVGDVDYGYVGDVTSVNAEALSGLLKLGVVPVMAPLSFDGQQLLNTNADSIASAVARGLARDYDVTLEFKFEKQGVLDSDWELVESLVPSTYETLLASGAIKGGMIPKLQNAFEALYEGVSRVIIGKTTISL